MIGDRRPEMGNKDPAPNGFLRETPHARHQHLRYSHPLQGIYIYDTSSCAAPASHPLLPSKTQDGQPHLLD